MGSWAGLWPTLNWAARCSLQISVYFNLIIIIFFISFGKMLFNLIFIVIIIPEQSGKIGKFESPISRCTYQLGVINKICLKKDGENK